MSVSPAVLLLSVAIGGPVLLLALAVLYHGALVARRQEDLDLTLAEAALSPAVLARMSGQPAAWAGGEADRDLLSEHVSSLVTRSADVLAERLEHMMAEMQGQLAQQRTSLETLLSGSSQSPVAAGASLGRAAGEYVHNESVPPISTRIARLIDEGLSDRAIARELRIGVEEVKIARGRGSRP